MSKRKTYSKEYKLEAIRLMELGDQTPGELAAQLGVKRTMLYKWQEQQKKHGEYAFRGPGRRPDSELDEVAQLRKELARVKEERDILKKAAAYFARELK
jgi:transposase